MNLFVADPGWGWWIILYFYLGGIAAGAFFTATLIDIIGGEGARELARRGYWIAFPLVALCGLFLTLDLSQPQRFWHMLVKSEVVDEALAAGWPWNGHAWAVMVQAPLFKRWSPMSVGSWALLLFGLCSGLAFLGSLWPDGRLAHLLRRSVLARVLQIIGCAVGFFVASYTGALLTATNQPIWSDSTWIAPLFLTSAASTGIAVLIFLAHYPRKLPAEPVRRLERADLLILVLELVVFLVFLGSLGVAAKSLLRTWHGDILLGGTLLLGLVVPLAIYLRFGTPGLRSTLTAAACTLVGGFLLRYGILTAPPELLARGPTAAEAQTAPATETGRGFLAHISPEDGRGPGDPGADPGNRPADLQPRSKVFTSE